MLLLNVPVNIFPVMSGRSHRFLGITSTFLGVNVSYTAGIGIEPPDISLRSQTYFCDETNRLNAAVWHDNSLFTGISREPIGLQRMFCGIEERERRILW